jgi:hypothetical protein
MGKEEKLTADYADDADREETRKDLTKAEGAQSAGFDRKMPDRKIVGGRDSLRRPLQSRPHGDSWNAKQIEDEDEKENENETKGQADYKERGILELTI